MIDPELLKKCVTDSEKETALFFDSIGLECIDLSFKIKDNNNRDLGEIDGIFLDKENEVIIIYDDSILKDGVNSKITTFFSKCQSLEFERQIFENIPNIPHYPLFILYIDKHRDSDANVNSLEHILVDNTFIIFKDDFEYYQLLSEKINRWAKNDLYNLINIKPTQMRVEIEATQIYIGNTPAYIFADRPDKILKYSYISRRRGNDNGYQRMVDFDRIKDIKNELESGNLLGFPNSILLNSTIKISNTPHPKSHCPKIIKLTIPNCYSACRIVDGQHRLLSFSQLNPNTQTRYNLPIVLMDNMEIESEIKMFLDINDSPKNVDPSLRYELTAQLNWAKDTDNYLTKVAVILVSELEKRTPIKGNIFKGIIGDHKKDNITLKSFVDSIKRHKLIDHKGGYLQQNENVDDIANPVKFIQQFLTQVNKEATDKEYFISNRGIELICNLLSHIISLNETSDTAELIDKYSTGLIKIVNKKVEELRKYQGEKGFKDAFDLIIQNIQTELPEENNITNCQKDHTITDELIKHLTIDQGGTGRHKCAACAYEEGVNDSKAGIKKQQIELVNKKIAYSQKAKRRHRSTLEAYNLGYDNSMKEKENA